MQDNSFRVYETFKMCLYCMYIKYQKGTDRFKVLLSAKQQPDGFYSNLIDLRDKKSFLICLNSS